MATPSSRARRADALWALFEEHGQDVYRFVHRRCGDHTMAEEVTQDVFVAALHAGPDGLGPGWLHRVARNRMIDMVRRRASYESKLRVVGDEAGSDQTRGDPAPLVADRVRMEAALAGISTLRCSVLMLRHIDGLSVRELAAAFDRSERGVEALLMRAKAALRCELEASDE